MENLIFIVFVIAFVALIFYAGAENVKEKKPKEKEIEKLTKKFNKFF